MVTPVNRRRLKLRPIRGVESAGMVLSEKELGLSDDHEGILVLPPDASPAGHSSNSSATSSSTSPRGRTAPTSSAWSDSRAKSAALTGQPLREPDRGYAGAGPPAAELVRVEIEDPDLCPRFTASVVQGVTIGPSPAWMQERLLRLGMRPINNVVDITNYVMLETGQPLHAFDYDLVREHRLIARRAKPGERLLTLDGVDARTRRRNAAHLRCGGPLSVAGIMGGGSSEVSDRTTNILLEVANFKRGSIRRTSSRLKLRTEASLALRKGHWPGDRRVRAGPRPPPLRTAHGWHSRDAGWSIIPRENVAPHHRIGGRAHRAGARHRRPGGVSPPASLAALGFVVELVSPARYRVQPPDWRPDVEIPDDLIEDIGRIYGYDKLPATTLRGSLPAAEPRPLQELRERVRDLAASLGFEEVISYTLTDRATLDRVVEPGDPERGDPLGVVNPVAAQHTFLRTSLRAGTLAAYAANRRHDDGPLRLFEIGFEYLPVEADLPHERTVLCAAIGGPRETRWGRPGSERLDFFDAKGAVEGLLASLGIDATFAADAAYGLLPGHTATISAKKSGIGVVAQVHPDTAAQFDIAEPVFLVELWIEPMIAALPERPPYLTPSKFPEVRQDIAILVDEALPADRVLRLARSHRSGGIRVEADVFDEYRGTGVPDGQKSLALRLRYQAPDRTLSDADVARVQAGLIKRLAQDVGATLRGPA